MNRLALIFFHLAVGALFLSLGIPVTILILTLELLVFLILFLLLIHLILNPWPSASLDLVEMGLLGIIGLILAQAVVLEIADWNTYLFSLLRFSAAFALYASARILLCSRERVRSFVRFFLGVSALFGAGIVVQTFLAKGGRPEGIQQSFLAALPAPLTLWVAKTLDPNSVVDLFIPGSFLSLAFLLYSLERQRDKDRPEQEINRQILWYGFLGMVLFAAVVFSYSRGGILAFVAGLGFFSVLLLLGREKGKLRLFFLAFAIFGLFLASLDLKGVFQEVGTLKRIAATQDLVKAELGMRWEAPIAALHMLKTLWPFGAGAGNLINAWFLHRPPQFQQVPYTLYNDPLQIGVELGIGGLALFLGVLAWAFFLLFRRVLKTRSRWVFYTGSACLATCVSYTVHSLVDPTFLVEPLLWLFVVVLGAGLSLDEVDRWKEEKKLKLGHRLVTSAGLMVLMVWLAGVSSVAGMKASAYLLSYFGGPDKYLVAGKLDPWNPYFDRQLAFIDQMKYREKGDVACLEKSLKAIEEALKKNSYVPQVYSLKAQLLSRLGRPEEVEAVFAAMRERFPHHFEQFLVPAVFYLEKSVVSLDEKERTELKKQGLTYYRSAMELVGQSEAAAGLRHYRIYLEDPFNFDPVTQLLQESKTLA